MGARDTKILPSTKDSTPPRRDLPAAQTSNTSIVEIAPLRVKAEDIAVRQANYIHNQTSVSTTWTVTHNLNRYPPITTVNTSDAQIIGGVVYTSINQITVTFSEAVAGRAFVG
jgi:hypothetical protein